MSTKESLWYPSSYTSRSLTSLQMEVLWRGSHGRDPAAESVAKPHILLPVHISIPLQLDGCGNVLVSFCRALLSSLRSVDCSLAGKSSEQ